MEKKPEPILEVDLGENGGKAIFTSFEEAQQWVQKENQFWIWFPNEARSDQNLGDLWTHIRGLFSRMEKELSNARPHVSDSNVERFCVFVKNRELPIATVPRRMRCRILSQLGRDLLRS